MNFLEQLVAEWYEFQGYFLRQNVWVGKLPKGGYECELDIVAFHPEKKHLVQIEPSMDASSWAERERRYSKKFKAGRKYIPALFSGIDIPEEIEQIALFVFASKKNRQTIAGGKIMLASEIFEQIFSSIKDRSIFSNTIPEQLPILRSLQFVAQYKNKIFQILMEKP